MVRNIPSETTQGWHHVSENRNWGYMKRNIIGCLMKHSYYCGVNVLYLFKLKIKLMFHFAYSVSYSTVLPTIVPKIENLRFARIVIGNFWDILKSSTFTSTEAIGQLKAIGWRKPFPTSPKMWGFVVSNLEFLVGNVVALKWKTHPDSRLLPDIKGLIIKNENLVFRRCSTGFCLEYLFSSYRVGCLNFERFSLTISLNSVMQF
jgi:hypothetical protein